MSLDWLIVDGYSLLYRERSRRPFGKPAPLERDEFIRRLERMCGSLAERVTVVFDGRDAGGPDEAYCGGVEVLYSPSSLTADSVIERLVHEHSGKTSIMVVTSDRRERETVEAAGVRTLSCGDFLDLCEEEERRRNGRLAMSRRMPPLTLGERFPPG
jgi:predicted RNA-binding protein with PIN domain